MKKVILLASALALLTLPVIANAQGIVRGAREGAREGNRDAGPLGGVVGGAVGGAVGGIEGGVKGILGIPQSSGGGRRERVMTVTQIVDNVAADTARLKADLKLTPEQDKNWPAFEDALRDNSQHGAARVQARIDRVRADPPMDVVAQMNKEADFLNERAADERKLADAAKPLYDSLDDRQRTRFTDGIVRLSSERRLD
jgi:gas vesicle protein